MKCSLTAALLALCFIGAPSIRAEEENPFKKSSVGDWAEYDLNTTAMNIKLAGKMKLTVIEKKDNEAKIKTTLTINGAEVAAPDVTIDLTKPFDPTSTTGLPNTAEAKVEKTDTAKEKLTLGGKSYDCTMTKMKVSAKVMGQNFDSDVKVWTCKDVPLSGMVKLEMKSQLVDMVLEYTGSGSKPAK